MTINVSVDLRGSGRGRVTGTHELGDETTTVIDCSMEYGQVNGTCTATFSSDPGCREAETCELELTGEVTVGEGEEVDSRFVTWGINCADRGELRVCTLLWNPSRQVWSFNVSARFDVLPGSIEVATQTLGDGEDPDGYSVSIGSDLTIPIGANDRIRRDDLEPGDYWVELTNVSENCTVWDPNPREVRIEPDETTETQFTIGCVPMVSTTAIEVTTETGGEDLDPDYDLTVESQTFYWNRTIFGNETLLVTVPWGGDYRVGISNVEPNCVVDTDALPNPRTVSVALSDTARTTFEVDCQAWGTLRVANETTGWDLDPNGYTLTVDGFLPQPLALNGTITFTQLVEGTYQITLGDIAGNCVVELSETKNAWVTWGADLQVNYDLACAGIAFESDRGGFREIWAMDSDGGNPAFVFPSTHTNTNPAWSPDRTEIVYTTGMHGDREIYKVNVSDGTQTRITNDPADDDDAVWSPDGQLILFASKRGGDQDLYVKSAGGGGTAQRITSAAGEDDDPDWSPVDPDGGSAQWIVFSSDRHRDGELYKMDISQNPLPGPIRLTDNFVKDDEPAWSPDGTMIAFSRAVGFNRAIVVMDRNGNNVTQLTDGTSWDSNPSWSPDGTMIAFNSNRNGDHEIFIMNADGSGVTNITNHFGVDYAPWWR